MLDKVDEHLPSSDKHSIVAIQLLRQTTVLVGIATLRRLHRLLHQFTRGSKRRQRIFHCLPLLDLHSTNQTFHSWREVLIWNLELMENSKDRGGNATRWVMGPRRYEAVTREICDNLEPVQ
jgi:hypothetical protein